MSEFAQPTYRPEIPTHTSPTMGTARTEVVTATTTAVAEAPVTFTGDRGQEVYRVASELFRQGPDWVTFFREILGVDGVARRLFPDADDFAEFEKSEEYLDVQQMLARLRGQNTATADGREPTRVITVRLPKSLHESLRAEAHDRKTSMNKLCISKLLQVIEQDLIPAERATSVPPRSKPAPQPIASSTPSTFGGTTANTSTSHFGSSQPTFRSASGF